MREYYYKSPPILMERFILRDPTTSFGYPLPPKTKTVFTNFEGEEGSNTQLCIVHYQGSGKGTREGGKVGDTVISEVVAFWLLCNLC